MSRKGITAAALSLLMLLLLALGAGLMRLHEKKPTFDASDLGSERVELDAKLNAFAVLQTAGESLSWDDPNAPQIEGMAMCNPRFEWNQELAEQLLTRNPGVLNVVDKALALPGLQVPAPVSFEDEFPYLPTWSELAMLRSIQAAVLFRRGLEQEAFDLALSLVEFGQRIEGSGGAAFHYRKGARIKTLGLNRIRQMAAQTSLPSERLVLVLKRLAHYHANEAALTNVFKIEYQLDASLVKDMAAGKFLGTNLMESFVRTVGMPMLKVAQTKQLFAQSARVGLKCIPHYFAEMPLQEFHHRPTNSSVMPALLKGNAFGEVLYDFDEPRAKELLYDKCLENVRLEATRLILALKCFKLEHGSLPDSLTALVPDYLPRLPTDDFDGKPLRYSSEKKLVYSIGRDLSDDGGSAADGKREHYDLPFKVEF